MVDGPIKHRAQKFVPLRIGQRLRQREDTAPPLGDDRDGADGEHHFGRIANHPQHDLVNHREPLACHLVDHRHTLAIFASARHQPSGIMPLG